MSFSVVVAATEAGGVGLAGRVPWRLPKDLAYFKKLTSATADAASGKRNALIMGRKTWDSIPAKCRPLPGRINVVVSANAQLREQQPVPDEVIVANGLADALASVSGADMADKVESVFVIGGGTIYKEALAHPGCGKVYLTKIHRVFECDTFLPSLAGAFHKTQTVEAHTSDDGVVPYVMEVYERLADDRPRHEEYQYLDLVREIMDHGVARGDRTGTGTLSKFGVQMRFSLRGDTLPLLTTKRTFWRGVAEELLWFVSGNTNAKNLQDKNIHIWDGNGSREFLDNLGLTDREEMDLGPVYGFQWRHFGAAYTNMHADYTGQGVDQLADCIRTLKTNPTDRRIVLSAWNPSDLKAMALPPCHMLCQFYVADGELSCQMYQRSADMGLGVPFNIASYALLTRLVAQVCGLKAGDFVHVIGDAHVYRNHVEALREQIKRTPAPFPTLKINPEKTDIDSFEFSDFAVEGYKPQAAVAMQMAV
jgi:dihydrofolate reductase/thymidylate synthase